jgi:hypothetical protein
MVDLLPAEASKARSGAPVTVRQEWMVIGVCAAAMIAAEALGYWSDPAGFTKDRTTGFDILGTLIGWFGHALWLTMDRRRRGLEIGAWRYGVIFFGPLAIWLYLILEYRRRAFYLIPLSVAVYAAIAVLMALVMAVSILVTHHRPMPPGF